MLELAVPKDELRMPNSLLLESEGFCCPKWALQVSVQSQPVLLTPGGTQELPLKLVQSAALLL